MKKIVNQNDKNKSFFRFKLCNFLNAVIVFLEKRICFKKEELDQINNRVKETIENEKKFKKVEENLPKLKKIVSSVDEENKELKKDLAYTVSALEALYKYELLDSKNERIEIYKKLGLHTEKIN